MWGIIIKGLGWVVSTLAIFFADTALLIFRAFGSKFAVFMHRVLLKIFAGFFLLAIASIFIRLVIAVFCFFFVKPEVLMNVILYVGDLDFVVACNKLPDEVCPILAQSGINDFINLWLNAFWRIGWFLFFIRGLKKLWIF